MIRRSGVVRRLGALAGAVLALALLGGWGGDGHRAITQVAIDLLPEGTPAWLRDESVIEQIAYQSQEPDRWRGTDRDALRHENNPDHYFDVELIEPLGLKMETLPEGRYDFVMLLGQALPAEISEEAPGEDDLTPERVGMAPWAVAEHHAKLVSSFSTLRMLEALDDPARAQQMEAARANVIRTMGQLSHFVADLAQPLHTTVHHHGWEGENPLGYTTDRGIHSMIDSGVVEMHGLDHGALLALKPSMRRIGVREEDAWKAMIAHIERSHTLVEPLYVLEKTGHLEGEAGRGFIAERMNDGASTLAGLYYAAWLAARPTPESIESFERYNPVPASAE
jgi:hypothetical protein